ncbi:MAG: hypothetical protein AB8B55_12855 [Mariniblastus sp.]
MTIKTRPSMQAFTSLLSLVWQLTIMSVVTTGLLSEVIFGPLFSIQPVVAQQVSDSQEWHTGRELDLFNRASVSADWTEAKRRERLLQFAKQQGVAVFFDRRVDPEVLINFGKVNCTMEQFYWAFAADQKLGVCRLGDFYYFGPIQTAHSLPIHWTTLAKQSSRLKKSAVNWTEKKPIKSETAIPSELLKDLAERNGFQITNPETIPHDVWAAFELPPTSLDQRVAILLVGFNKWFERSDDGTKITIIELPMVTEGRVEFASIKDAKKVALKLKSQFRSTRIRGTGRTLTATGLAGELAKVRQRLVDRQVPEQTELSARTWSLKFPRARRISVLKKIAEQTGLELITTEAPDEKLTEAIGLEVKDANLSELIEATLGGSGLKFDLSKKTLRVFE